MLDQSLYPFIHFLPFILLGFKHEATMRFRNLACNQICRTRAFLQV